MVIFILLLKIKINYKPHLSETDQDFFIIYQDISVRYYLMKLLYIFIWKGLCIGVFTGLSDFFFTQGNLKILISVYHLAQMGLLIFKRAISVYQIVQKGLPIFKRAISVDISPSEGNFYLEKLNFSSQIYSP